MKICRKTELKATDWELLSVKGESGQWALKFLKALYSEYLNESDPVFLGDTVDIGVDEYWSIKNDEFDGMRNYIREMADTVQESGKSTYVGIYEAVF